MTSLMRWSPISERMRFEREGAGWFGPLSLTIAASELVREADGWRLRVALSGVEPERIELETHDGMLSVSGEVGSRNPWEAGPGVTQFAYGRFCRTFAIPRDVAVDGITASYNNGMLVVALPSGRSVTSHSIGVNTTAVRAIPVGAERWLDKGRRFLRRLRIGSGG